MGEARPGVVRGRRAKATDPGLTSSCSDAMNGPSHAGGRYNGERPMRFKRFRLASTNKPATVLASAVKKMALRAERAANSCGASRNVWARPSVHVLAREARWSVGPDPCRRCRRPFLVGRGPRAIREAVPCPAQALSRELTSGPAAHVQSGEWVQTRTVEGDPCIDGAGDAYLLSGRSRRKGREKRAVN